MYKGRGGNTPPPIVLLGHRTRQLNIGGTWGLKLRPCETKTKLNGNDGQ